MARVGMALLPALDAASPGIFKATLTLLFLRLTPLVAGCSDNSVQLTCTGSKTCYSALVISGLLRRSHGPANIRLGASLSVLRHESLLENS